MYVRYYDARASGIMSLPSLRLPPAQWRIKCSELIDESQQQKKVHTRGRCSSRRPPVPAFLCKAFYYYDYYESLEFPHYYVVRVAALE